MSAASNILLFPTMLMLHMVYVMTQFACIVELFHASDGFSFSLQTELILLQKILFSVHLPVHAQTTKPNSFAWKLEFRNGRNWKMCKVPVIRLHVCWLSLLMYSARPCCNWTQVSRSAVERALFWMRFFIGSKRLYCITWIFWILTSRVVMHMTFGSSMTEFLLLALSNIWLGKHYTVLLQLLCVKV